MNNKSLIRSNRASKATFHVCGEGGVPMRGDGHLKFECVKDCCHKEAKGCTEDGITEEMAVMEHSANGYHHDEFYKE